MILTFRRTRTITGETVSSVSSAVDEKTAKRGDIEFDVVVVPEDEPTDDDSLNDQVLVAHL